MKILWCHEVSYRDKPVYEYQDFPERLAARGHEVEVLDFREDRAVDGDSERISRTGVGEVTVTSIPHHNLGPSKYLEARLRFSHMLSARLARGDVDALFVYSVFINGTEAVRLARKHGVPVVYRVLDAYHRLRPGRVTQTLLRYGERYIYRNADRVLLTNEQMQGYVSEVAGLDVSGRCSVVDHGVDSEHFAPRPRDPELVARYRIAPTDTIAVFLGTTYVFSGLLELIRRLPQLIAQHPTLKLLIVGGGELDHELAALVRAEGLQDRVLLTGMVPYTEVPRFLSLASIALNPFEINDITRDIVPIKILQYQAAALPVLSTPLPDLTRKHMADRSGVQYSASDHADSFAQALATLLTRPDELVEKGQRGLRFVRTHYSVAAAVDRIEDAFKQLRTRR